MLKVELPEAHWNIIIEALILGKYGIVSPVMDSLKVQLTNGIQHGDNNGSRSEDASIGG